MNIRMRARHLLCTTEFSGHGYSEGFTAHLEEVVSLLHNGENHTVTLVDHPDLICGACPKLIRDKELSSGSCSADHNRIVYKDRDVLDALHLQADVPYPFSELLEALLNTLDEASFSHLCGNCSWYKVGLCSCESLKENAASLRAAVQEENAALQEQTRQP